MSCLSAAIGSDMAISRYSRSPTPRKGRAAPRRWDRNLLSSAPLAAAPAFALFFIVGSAGIREIPRTTHSRQTHLARLARICPSSRRARTAGARRGASLRRTSCTSSPSCHCWRRRCSPRRGARRRRRWAARGCGDRLFFTQKAASTGTFRRRDVRGYGLAALPFFPILARASTSRFVHIL